MKQQKHYLRLFERYTLAVTKEYAPELILNRTRRINPKQAKIDFPGFPPGIELNLKPFEIIELAVSLHEAGAFKPGTKRKDVYSYFESLTNTQLVNPANILSKIKDRSGNKTVYLDSLKNSFNTLVDSYYEK